MTVMVIIFNAGLHSTMEAIQLHPRESQKVTNSSWSAIVHCCSEVNEAYFCMQGVRRKATAFSKTVTQTKPEYYQKSIEIEVLHKWSVVKIDFSYTGRRHAKKSKNANSF